MFRPLRLRFFLIVLLLFFALFWDFNKWELRTTIQIGVCDEFDYANWSCHSGQNLIITSYPAMLIDPVALLMVLGLTYLGSYGSGMGIFLTNWNGRLTQQKMPENWLRPLEL